MAKHSRPTTPIDSRRTTVLAGFATLPGVAKMTVAELGALVDMMRDAQLRTEDAGSSGIWREMRDIRLEVRSLFIRKFFEVRQS